MLESTRKQKENSAPTNYDKSAAEASRLFLGYDQESIIRMFSLEHDDDTIRLKFIDQQFSIDRRSGVMTCLDTGVSGDFGPTLSVFDILCRSKTPIHPSGEWVTLAQLANRIGSGPTDPSGMMRGAMEKFTGHPELLAKAWEALGGVPKKGGEVSYLLPVFKELHVWLQFWDADDEFPASLRFLWDSTTPEHLHYETVWYVMGCITDRLCQVV